MYLVVFQRTRRGSRHILTNRTNSIKSINLLIFRLKRFSDVFFKKQRAPKCLIIQIWNTKLPITKVQRWKTNFIYEFHLFKLTNQVPTVNRRPKLIISKFQTFQWFHGFEACASSSWTEELELPTLRFGISTNLKC